MKALILDGSLKDEESLQIAEKTIVGKLESSGWDTEIMRLRERKVADCLGCFGCWLKTPGICVIDDDGRNIAKAFINSDLVVFLTPVTFGGYSSELKKAVDRLIPTVLPYFKTIHGETHHGPRYVKYPNAVFIGLLQSDDAEAARIFNALAYRNTINFYCKAYAVDTITPDETRGSIEANIQNVLRDMGVVQ